MAKKSHGKAGTPVGPNMTPMVDIVMCILIFFMMASSFAVVDMYLTSNMPAIDKKGMGNAHGDAVLPAVQNKIEIVNVGDGPRSAASARSSKASTTPRMRT